MAEKIVIEVEVETSEASKELKQVNKQTKQVADNTKDIGTSAKGSTGGLAKLTNGFKAMNVALGVVGLVVAGFVALKEAFVSSEEGQNKYNKAMAILGSVLDNITEVVSILSNDIVDLFENPLESLQKFGDLVKDNIVNRFEGLYELIPQLAKAVNLLFEGEFSKAGEVAANAMGKVTLGVEDVVGKTREAIAATSDFIYELIEEGKVAANISDTRANLDKIERDLLVQRAKANRDIAEARAIAADRDNKTTEERIKGLEEASRIEQEITARELQAAQLRLNAKIQENALANSTKEDLLEEAQLQADLINLQTASANQQKALIAEITTTKREAAAEEKAIDDQAAAEKKEREEQDAADKEELRKAEESAANEAAKAELDRIAKEKAAREAMLKARLDLTRVVLSSIANLAEEGSAIAKAAALVSLAIDTTLKAQQAFALGVASFPLPYGAIVGVAAAGLVVASGVKAGQQIASGSTSTGSTPTGGSVRLPPQETQGGEGTLGDVEAPQFSIRESQLENDVNGQVVKAYVVANDVTTQQELDRNTVSSATL